MLRAMKIWERLVGDKTKETAGDYNGPTCQVKASINITIKTMKIHWF